MFVTIERIAPADDVAMAALVRSCLRDAGLALPGTAYFDPQLDHMSEFYVVGRRAYFVAHDERGGVVGGAGLGEVASSDGVAELQKLYVDAAARGHGVATRLVDLVEGAAREFGYHALYLETHHALANAIRLYERLGFRRLEGPCLAVPTPPWMCSSPVTCSATAGMPCALELVRCLLGAAAALE